MPRRNKMIKELNYRANNFGLKRDVLYLIGEVQNRHYEYSLKHQHDRYHNRVGKWHRLYQFNTHEISVIKLQDSRLVDKDCKMYDHEKQKTAKLVYEMLIGQETWTFDTWREMKAFIISGEMDKELYERWEQEDDWNRDHDYDYDLRDQEDRDREEYESNQVDQLAQDELQVTQGHVESDENIVKGLQDPVTSTRNDIGSTHGGV